MFDQKRKLIEASHLLSLENIEDQTIEYAFTLLAVKPIISPFVKSAANELNGKIIDYQLAFFKKALGYKAVQNTILNKDFKPTFSLNIYNADKNQIALYCQYSLYNALKVEAYYTKNIAIPATVTACFISLALLYGSIAFNNNFKLFACIIFLPISLSISKFFIIDTRERFIHYSLVDFIDNVNFIKSGLLEKELINLNRDEFNQQI